MSQPEIHNWDNSEEVWQAIISEAYSEGKAYISFPEFPGVSVLFVEDLLSEQGERA